MEGIAAYQHDGGHYTDAESKIRILTQRQRKYYFVRFRAGRRYSLHYAGCGLFALAHAIQWLTGRKLADSTEEDRLIRRLLDYRINTFSSLTYALQVAEDRYGSIVYHQGALNRDTLTAEKVKKIFDDGGVIITIPRVHYLLAVGYRYHNGRLYIHMVDSSPESTIEPREGHDLHIGYSFDSMREIRNPFPGGAQYWIPWECFSGNCSHTERRFGDWWWLSSKPEAPAGSL